MNHIISMLTVTAKEGKAVFISVPFTLHFLCEFSSMGEVTSSFTSQVSVQK